MSKPRGVSREQPHPVLAKCVGDTARAARLEASLTQADVAERIGIIPEVYGRLERGIMLPSVPTFRRLAVALRLSSDVMMGLTEELVKVDRRPVDEESSVELRRLLRNLRKLDTGQLKLIQIVANAIKTKRAV